jgi:hypothetical protein
MRIESGRTFKTQQEIAEYYVEERNMDPEDLRDAMRSLGEQMNRYLGASTDVLRGLPEQKMRRN